MNFSIIGEVNNVNELIVIILHRGLINEILVRDSPKLNLIY